jgi:hypothetical protein
MPNGLNTNWIDAASRLVVQVGFPVVVAGILLWFVLGKFQGNMNAITTRMETNAHAVERLCDSIEGQHSELVAQTDLMRQQSAQLAMQTDHLRDQSKLMADIAKDAQTLVDIRNQELQLLQRLKQEHLPTKP